MCLCVHMAYVSAVGQSGVVNVAGLILAAVNMSGLMAVALSLVGCCGCCER